MDYVIGSGPSGISAAAALLGRGLPVTVLDAGGRLEPGIQSRVDGLGGAPPESWSPSELEALRGRLRYNAEGAPLKLVFGSDYPYRDVDSLQPVSAEGVDAYRCFAEGGLSVLWGASVLPYSDEDLRGWPLSEADLREHYAAALRLTGLSADRDELERLYPLHVEPSPGLALSAQARFVMERLRAHAGALGGQRVHFGKARLAIGGAARDASSCAYCGFCLYGCPYGLIYSSRATLRSLLAGHRQLRHVSGFVVRKLVERDGAVRIHAISRESGEERAFEASRVFLAAGAFASTAILLESLEACGRPVAMRQSDHFLLPLLLRKAVRGVSGERLHTLCQVFIEVLDPSISGNAVHLQLYTYNDLFSRMARQKLGPLHPVLRPAIDRLLPRIALLKGYLHSDDSPGIRVTLRPGRSAAVLHLEPEPNPATGRIVDSVARLLSRNSGRIGAWPLRLGLRRGLPGSGAHVGGSFPMGPSPREFGTDTQGRPAGFRRVHVVDSTVFPSIPAATITLTAMANAHRIASLAGAGEAGGVEGRG